MSDPTRGLRSTVTGQAWPALPSARGAMLAALLYQFERTQWLPPAELFGNQLSQLKRLLVHAQRSVPFYRQRLAHLDLQAGLTPGQWHDLTPLSRRAVQSAGDQLHSDAVPPEFGAVTSSETSGSTGEPVKLRLTELDRLMWEATTLREHYWHARDFSAKLASIRVFGNGLGTPPNGTLVNDWGAPASELHATGPMAMLALDTDVALQARWLCRHAPDYLLTYPTNLLALIEHAEAHGWSLPDLREVRTVGETVTPELRERCSAAWGVPLVDVYSSRELGYIALQCPLSGLYHVSAETALVEVLDEDGRTAQAGDVGRLVVTPLHNYASPLLRYELNDYAEVGPACPCGRGLPTLTRILGRSRNMVVLPDGRRYWPLLGFGRYREIAPVIQYQLVQRTRDQIDVNLVVERPLTAGEQERLGAIIKDAIGYPFSLDFKYFEGAIPRGKGGKYEEFISLLED